MPEEKIFKQSFLGIIPVAIFAGFIALFAGLPSLILMNAGGIIITLIAVLVIVFTYLSIKMTSYELREDGLFIRRGIIAKKQILLLYTQIQDVSEFQTLWGKIIGLKTLQIKTMTVSSALAGHLNNLIESDAHTIKQLLIAEINTRSKSHKKNPQKNSVVYDSIKEQNPKEANPYQTHFIRKGLINLLMTVIFAIIVVTGMIIFDAETSSYVMMLFIFIIMCASTLISYVIKQETYKYWISENTITIKSGLLNTQKTVIEYEKVQDFILTQTVTDRILGLASIHIETGSIVIATGNDNKQVPNYDIEALTLEDARLVVSKLMKKTDINYVLQGQPKVKDIPLDKKSVIKSTIAGIIGLFILFGIIIGITWVATLDSPSNTLSKVVIVSSIIGLILAIWTIIYQNMYYNRYFYDWTKETMTIRKGVIGRQQIFLPFYKVQNVFVYQGLLDRIFGLYNIRLSTVGNGSMYMCNIAGLSKENADKIVPLLMKAVKANS